MSEEDHSSPDQLQPTQHMSDQVQQMQAAKIL